MSQATMKAAVLKEIGKPIAIENVAFPEPADSEIIVETRACGICGTDLHMIDGWGYTPELPFIMGHEPAGIVKELGPTAQGFEVGDRVKIAAHSKGRGFAGVVKRHGFSGGPKTHGQSDRHRAPGSIGQSANPKRVFKGLRMAGRYGNERHSIRNLRVLKVFEDKNLLLIEGSIPGARNGIVEIIR